MWHVRRVHFEGVGHSDARFDPLTIELTDANGDPTDSVLWLENMGGKTSWVSLVLSVLRPDRREFLGALRDEKYIEDYVLGPDTAHVVIEWQRLGPPSLVPHETPRLVTGQVLQWKDRRVDTENADKRLLRKYYGFVADTSMDFDSLPFRTPSGQRRALPDFVEMLARGLVGSDAQRATSNQNDWHTWLEQHGLDPEVFRYQLLMNADEGAVAEQFQWASGNAFVRWALPYVVNPTVPDEIAAAVGLVREFIGRRSALELESEFCAQVGSSLQQTAEAHERYVDAVTQLGVAFDDAVALAGRFSAGSKVARTRALAAESYVTVLSSQIQEASRQANQCGRQRVETLLVAADLRVQELSAAHAGAEAHHIQQQSINEAWDAVPLLIEAQNLEYALNQARSELEAHHTGTGPLRQLEATASAKLARRLADVVDRATRERDRAQSRASAARAAETRARAAEHQLEDERDAAIAAASTAKSRVAALDEEMTGAVEEGLLHLGELPSAGVAHWSKELETRAVELTTCQRRRDDALTQAQAAREAVVAAHVALSPVQAKYSAALERRQALAVAQARLQNDPALREVAQQTSFDPWHAPEVVLERLAETARIAMLACVRVEVEATDDRRAAFHLGLEKLLPPSPDVERGLAVLDANDVYARSGWQVLRDRYPPDKRAVLVERYPELVSGILLRDADEVHQAVKLLKTLELGLPLVVAPFAALERDLTPGGVVLGGPTALYDEEAAQIELGHREARLNQIESKLAGHNNTEQVVREAATRYRLFLDHWPAAIRDQIEIDFEQVARQREVAVGTLSDAEMQQITDEATFVRASHEVSEAEIRHADARIQAERVRGLAKRADARGNFERELQLAVGRRVATESARAQAREEAIRYRNTISLAQGEAAEFEGRRREAMNHLARCELSPTLEGSLPSESPDVLERAWRKASVALERVRRDDVLLTEEQRLTEELGRVQRELSALTPAARTEMERLVALSLGVGAADRATERQLARQVQDASGRALGALEKELEEARKIRTERYSMPRDRTRLDTLPSTAAEAEALAEALQALQTLHNSAAGALERQRSEYTTAIRADTDAAVRLEDIRSNLCEPLEVLAPAVGRSWPLAAADATPWVGGVPDAEDVSRSVNRKIRKYTQARSDAAEHRQRALSEVDRTANSARFASVVANGPLHDRLLRDAYDIRAAGAAEMARHLECRARSIELDLAEIDQRRQKIAELLVGQVRSAVQLLQNLQSQSRLPEGLDAWSGKFYLTVRHRGLPSEQKQLLGCVSTVVDRACDPTKRPSSDDAGKKQRNEGITLLFEALRAAVGDFEVGILKPHKVLRDRRVSVAEIRTFSGGQKITAALVLFAALTRLREINRLRNHDLGRADAGATLILDNPIGKSSAHTLIEVQRRVAKRCRLQLIYTTGVSDLGALGLFTCVVRLDGKENLRTGAQHVVEVEHTIEGVRLVQNVRPAAINL